MVFEKEKKIFEKLGMEMPELCIFTEVNKMPKMYLDINKVMLQEDFERLSANKSTEHKLYHVMKEFCEITGIPEENFALIQNDNFLGCNVIFNSKYYYSSGMALDTLFNTLLNDKEAMGYVKMYLDELEVFLKDEKAYNIKRFEETVFTKNHPNIGSLMVEFILRHAGQLKYADDMLEIELLDKSYLPTYIYLIGEEMGQAALEKLVAYYEQNSDKVNYDKEYIYELFREIYQISNKNFSLFSKTFSKIYSEDYAIVMKHRDALKKLADENGYIEIYRGSTPSSTPVREAMSWTLSEAVACSFAFRYYSDNGYTLYKGKIHVDDILDNFLIESVLDRNELEVLVNPSKIQEIEEISVPDTFAIIELLEKKNVHSTIFDEEINVVSLIFEGIDLLEELEIELGNVHDEVLFECSDLHGMSHTKRVIYNTLTVAALHKEQLQLTGEDFDVLLVAAMLHDIGREHDWEDYEHGQMSVEKYSEFFDTWYDLEGENLEICKFLMANHNIPDEMAKENLQSHELIEDKERAEKLYNLLCDGDGLDRVRLGDLNVAFLRNEKSKLLLPFAYDVLASI